MDRQTLREDIEIRLGDPQNKIWSDAMLNGYLDEAYHELVERTNLFWHREPLAVTASDGQYDLPSDYIRMERVTWDDILLDVWTARELSELDANFATTEGDPIESYLLSGFAHMDINLFPVPSASHATKLQLEFYRRGAAVSADDDDYEIPDHYIRYMRFYVLSQCYLMEGDGQELRLAELFKELWEAGVDRLAARVKRSSVVAYSALGSGPAPVKGPRPAKVDPDWLVT